MTRRRMLLLWSLPALFAIAVLLAAFASREDREAAGNQTAQRGDCGPRALAAAALRLGVPLDVDTFVKQCEVGPGGISFGALEKLAREGLGLRASLGRIDWRQLLERSTPCVVHLRRDHFVMVDPGRRDDENRVQVIEADSTVHWWDEGKLTSEWSDGAVLTLDREPGATIDLGDAWKHVGTLVNETRTEIPFEIQNTGTEDVVLSVASKSCGCVGVKPESLTLPPGETGTIDCQVDMHGKWGPFSQHVLLQTGGAEPRRMSLYMGGEAYIGPTLVPDQVFLGDVLRGEERQIEILIRGPRRGEEVRVENVEVVPIGTEEERLSQDVAVTWTSEVVGTLPHARRVTWPQADPHDALVRLTISPSEESAVRAFQRRVRIVTQCQIGDTPGEVLLSGRVAPAVEWSPRALIVRDGGPETGAELTVRAVRSESLPISGVELVGLSGLAVEELEPTRGAERRYRVYRESPGDGSGQAGSLRITLKADETVSVPVAYLTSKAGVATEE